jgi:hypothetical protein
LCAFGGQRIRERGVAGLTLEDGHRFRVPELGLSLHLRDHGTHDAVTVIEIDLAQHRLGVTRVAVARFADAFGHRRNFAFCHDVRLTTGKCRSIWDRENMADYDSDFLVMAGGWKPRGSLFIGTAAKTTGR